MKLKPFYKLDDFDDRKGLGKNWMCKCPKCERKHLSINKNTGLYHCFTPGCDFNGILEEYKDKDKDKDNASLSSTYTLRSNQPQSKKRNTLPTTQKSQHKNEEIPDFLPEDYTQLSVEVTSQLQAIDPESNDPTQVVVREYLEAQGIAIKTAKKLGVMCAVKACMNSDKSVKGPCVAYVNRVYGNVVNVKYRLCTDKLFTQDVQPEKNQAPSAPYNIECLNPLRNVECRESSVECQDGSTTTRQNSLDTRQQPLDTRQNSLDTRQQPLDITLIITEGEKDVLTVVSATGHPYVISMPNGAESKPEVCFAPFIEWLEAVDRVIICGDEDRAGRVMKRNLQAYFADRPVAICRMSTGCKDISDVSKRYGYEEVRRVIESVQWPEMPDMMRIRDDREGILSVLAGNVDEGYSIGYGPNTDRHLRLTDEGGLIVVTGRPNSGKTDWMRCTLAKLMMQLDKRVCFLSFEEPNKRKQVRHFVELRHATRHTADIPLDKQFATLDFLDQHMVNLHMTSTPPTPHNIIALCEQLRSEQGFMMDFLYVDPYLFIDNERPLDSETQQIKHVLTTFQNWARDHHIWVIVVAHPRKLVKEGNGEYEEVDEYSISGSAHWANLADYLLSVKRVFPAGNTDNGSANPSFTVVNVLKVRDQEICHTGKLYFLRQPNGRYEERLDEEACRADINKETVTYQDNQEW